MRLTIIVPLLGTLVLFNQELVEWAKISEAAVRAWLKVPPGISVKEVAQEFTMTRLEKLYLGFTALGVGAGLYGIFCPREIKLYGSSHEYLAAQRPLMTHARSVGLMATAFKQWETAESSFGLSRHLNRELIAFANEALGEGHNSGPDSQSDRKKILRMALASRDADGRGNAERYATDLLSIHHQLMSESRAPARCSVLACYLVGFTLLLEPTASTFFLIVRRMIGL